MGRLTFDVLTSKTTVALRWQCSEAKKIRPAAAIRKDLINGCFAAGTQMGAQSYLIFSDNRGLGVLRSNWLVSWTPSQPPPLLSDGSTGSGTLHLIGLDGMFDQCDHGLETVILSDGTDGVCEGR